MSLSDTTEADVLKLWRGNGAGTSYTAWTNIYAKLHKADPTDANPSTTGHYGTTGVDRSLVELAFGAPSGTTSMALSGAFTPTWASLLTADTLTHISLWNSSTLSSQVPTGTCAGSGALTSSIAVNVGDTFVLSSFTFSMD